METHPLTRRFKGVVSLQNKLRVPYSLACGMLERPGDHGRVVFIILITSLFTIMPVGYHMVVLNVPTQTIQKSINESFYSNFGVALQPGGLSLLWSIIIASQAIGALIGCAIVIPLTSMYGAKTAMMTINNVILILGSLIMASTYYFSLSIALPLGRLFTGVYTGIACALVPLYVQQIAPKEIKGSLSCFMHIAVCFGSALGAIFSLDFMLGGEKNWGALLALPALFGFGQLIASFFIPDTPNHLLQYGSYTQALEAIRFYYDLDCDDEDVTVQKYWDLVPEMPSQMSFSSAIMNQHAQIGILLGIIVSATQIFSGAMVTISYSTSMFSAVSFVDIMVPFLPALGSIISIILTIPSLKLVESCGRRPLLLKTLVLCLAADCLIMLFSLLSQDAGDWWASWGFALSFLMYGVGYNLGIGPVAYFIPAELVPPEAASASLGAAVATNWICSAITTLFYYPLSVSVGGWSYLMFIAPTAIFLLLLWRFLPETKTMENTVDIRLLNDIGPPAYGSFETPEIF